MAYRCIFCSKVNEIGPFCECIREKQRVKAMTKPEDVKTGDQIFELADKFGVKKEMIKLIKFCINLHGQTPPAQVKFGAEELFFAMQTGMQDAGVPENFQFRGRPTLGRGHLFGFLLGRMILKESENSNVETSDKT